MTPLGVNESARLLSSHTHACKIVSQLAAGTHHRVLSTRVRTSAHSVYVALLSLASALEDAACSYEGLHPGHQVPLRQDGCRGFTSGEHFVVHAINKAGHGNLAKILSFKTAAEADAVGDYLAGISTSPAAKAAHDSAMSAVVATVNGVGRTRTACSL